LKSTAFDLKSETSDLKSTDYDLKSTPLFLTIHTRPHRADTSRPAQKKINTRSYLAGAKHLQGKNMPRTLRVSQGKNILRAIHATQGKKRRFE
jgi:hypothetical protein